MPDKKTPEELKKDLEKIYADGEGEMPDFTKLDGKPGSRLKSALLFLVAFLVVLAGVSWAGFIFFVKQSKFTGDKVSLTIEGPSNLTAGAETVLTVHYRNDENIPLASGSVSVELPKEFSLESADPALPESGVWEIGTLAPGTEGTITLKGTAEKELGSLLTFNAALNYKPADFNSPFQKPASLTIPVSDSVLQLSASGPDSPSPGDKIEFSFNYQNVSDRDVDNVRFEVDPLDGFVFDSADPAPTQENQSRWNLGKLVAHASGTVIVRGTFSSAARGPKALHGRLGFVTGDTMVVEAGADAQTDVLKSDLTMSLIVNGSAAPPAVSFGDILHFSIDYKNGGDLPLSDVTLDAELPSTPAGTDVIDWVTLKDDLGGTRKGSVITWTKKQIPGLAELKPGDEGTIDFAVQLVTKPDAKAANSDYGVNALIRAKIAKVGKTSPGREVVSDPLAIKLNSDTVFKTFGRYYDDTGVPLGSGPLPPQVGQTTVYRINWVIQNTLHELDNLTVSTILPQGVKWTGQQRQVDAGDLTFDSTGRQATWRLNKMPTSVQTLTVSFDVQVTPGFEDVGNIIDLTGDNRFEAVDKATGSVILKTERPVGTDLLGDDAAAGKGIVRE